MKRFLLLALALLVLVVFFGGITKFILDSYKGNKAAFEPLLRSWSSIEVFLDGKSALLRSGSVSGDEPLSLSEQDMVLRIGWYHAVHRADPILSFSGADLLSLEKGIKLLLSEREHMEGLVEDRKGKEAIRNLYPASFLLSLPRTESLRRELLERPSRVGVESYHAALKETLAAYITDISVLRDIFKEQWSSGAKFSALSGGTDVKHILHGLELLRLAAEEASFEEERRYSCYRGVLRFCSSAERKMLSTQGDDGKQLSDSPLNPEYLAFLRSLYVSRARYLHYDTIHILPPSEQVIEITNTSCGFRTPERYFYLEVEDELSGLRAAKTDALSEIVFYDSERAAGNGGYPQYFKELAHAGYRIYYQGLTPYVCLDSGLDLARVLTVSELHRLTRISPIAATLHDERVTRAEQELLEAPYPSDSLAENYVVALSASLHDSSGFRDEISEKEAERRVDLWRSQTAGFEKALMNILTSNSWIPFFLNEFHVDPRGILLSRSSFSLFFVPFNESLVSPPVRFLNDRTPAWEKEGPAFLPVRIYRGDVEEVFSLKDVIPSVTSQWETSRKLREDSLRKGESGLNTLSLGNLPYFLESFLNLK